MRAEQIETPHPIPDEALDRPTAFVGATGSGKTVAAKGGVERLLERGQRVTVVDPTGVWWGMRTSADGKSPGFNVVIFGGEHADVPITPADGERLGELVATGHLQCIVDTSELSGGETARFLTPFFEALYAKNRGAMHLVLDEADAMAPQNAMPEGKRLLGAVDKIARRGRVKGFRLWSITQRPAVLNKNVLSQIATLVALQLGSPQDRKAIEAWVRGNADADQAREVLDTLPQLQRGEGWVWCTSLNVLSREHFPLMRTFDSSSTPEHGAAQVEARAFAKVDVAALKTALAPEPEAARPEAGAGGRKSGGSGKSLSPAQREYDRGVEDGIRRGIVLGFEQARRALAEAERLVVVTRDAAHHASRDGVMSDAERARRYRARKRRDGSRDAVVTRDGARKRRSGDRKKAGGPAASPVTPKC